MLQMPPKNEDNLSHQDTKLPYWCIPTHLTAVMWSSDDYISVVTRLITQPLKWFNLYLFSNLYLEADNEWSMNYKLC